MGQSYSTGPQFLTLLNKVYFIKTSFVSENFSKNAKRKRKYPQILIFNKLHLLYLITNQNETFQEDATAQYFPRAPKAYNFQNGVDSNIWKIPVITN